MAEQYAYDLRRIGGYDVLTAPGGEAALDLLTLEPVDAMVLDLEMPGLDGFGVLRAMRQRAIGTPVVVYTGTGNFDRCVQAVKLGAYGFIDKAEPVERVVQEIESAIDRKRLEDEVGMLRRRMVGEGALVGDSPAMQRLRETLARLAPIPSPVLVLGESGTGKELAAHELHRLGSTPSAPFIAVNCAALPEQLVESELFGHERGAFTGAAALRKGAFEAAGKGTLFLDEIGELPLAAQAKLLRVLEERQVTRLGGTRTVPVQARVVAATNRELGQEVAEGRFRKDLLYRLNVHTVTLPPLDERRSDIPRLAERFLESICGRFGMRAKRLSPEALAALMEYGWRQNNVRELRNVIERMILAADGDVIGADCVPDDIGGGAPPPRGEARTYQERRAEAERRILLEALEENEWQITRTARELGLADHSSLLKIMRRLGVEKRSEEVRSGERGVRNEERGTRNED